MRKLLSRITIIIAAIATLVLVSGCASYRSSAYGVSSDNVLTMREMEGTETKLSVGDFTAAVPGRKVNCRAAGAIKLPPATPTYESYIREAFISELKLAGLYDEGADIVLEAKLDAIDMDSQVGNGKWEFHMTFNVNERSFSITERHNFSTNWVADKACQQVAQELAPAVQKLIGAVIRSEDFRALLE